jgi:lia operon protein LiaF
MGLKDDQRIGEACHHAGESERQDPCVLSTRPCGNEGGSIVRLFQNRLAGWIILGAGALILWGLTDWSFVGSLVLFIIGVILLRNHRRRWGYGFLLLSAIVFISHLAEVEWGWIAFSILLVFFGYRLFTGRSQEKTPEIDGGAHVPPADLIVKKSGSPNAMAGTLHLMNLRYDLVDLNRSAMVNDIKLDLSKAIIPEGESAIVISGLIGDVDIYVPDDLDVSVAATVSAGYLDILGHHQGGVNRQIMLETKGYEQARRKVKISISLLVGDVGVRQL